MPKKIEEWMDDFDAVFERKGLFYSQEEVDALGKLVVLETINQFSVKLRDDLKTILTRDYYFQSGHLHKLVDEVFNKFLSSEYQDSNLTLSVTKLGGTPESLQSSPTSNHSSPDDNSVGRDIIMDDWRKRKRIVMRNPNLMKFARQVTEKDLTIRFLTMKLKNINNKLEHMILVKSPDQRLVEIHKLRKEVANIMRGLDGPKRNMSFYMKRKGLQ